MKPITSYKEAKKVASSTEDDTFINLVSDMVEGNLDLKSIVFLIKTRVTDEEIEGILNDSETEEDPSDDETKTEAPQKEPTEEQKPEEPVSKKEVSSPEAPSEDQRREGVETPSVKEPLDDNFPEREEAQQTEPEDISKAHGQPASYFDGIVKFLDSLDEDAKTLLKSGTMTISEALTLAESLVTILLGPGNEHETEVIVDLGSVVKGYGFTSPDASIFVLPSTFAIFPGMFNLYDFDSSFPGLMLAPKEFGMSAEIDEDVAMYDY